MTKDEAVAFLEEWAILLELQGENAFRVNAYRNAARSIEQLPRFDADYVKSGGLTGVRGIGDTLATKLREGVETGTFAELDALRAETPPGLRQMLRLPGVGPKKVMAIRDALKITDLEALARAVEDGSLAKLKGFGAKSAEKIGEGIRFLAVAGNRVRRDQALPLGLAMLERLQALPGVRQAELCGSLRRRRDTVKDLDLLVVADDPVAVMQAFTTAAEVVNVVAHGSTKASVVAKMMLGTETVTLPADLRVVEASAFPFALHYFTGSKQHNIRMRQRAIDQGASLNEYALTGKNGPIPCADEPAIFRALGLDWIPPELREDTGEIEAALAGTLPKLVTDDDLHGVFHNHTTASDGVGTLEEMALAAKKLGWEYLGIADHSQSLKIARGLSVASVRKQWAEIDALNDRLTGMRVLKGIECDILDDGSLDYDDATLAGFDYVVASVHTVFGMPSEEMTARICKALAHPAVTMLGHATGRLLLRRDAYKLDLDAVLRTAAKFGKMIEINAQPMRLDLDWLRVKQAKSLGIPLVINPDAHAPEELALTSFGVDVARRGWLEKADVFNTRRLPEVLKTLAKMKA